jgi:hypothetical protein
VELLLESSDEEELLSTDDVELIVEEAGVDKVELDNDGTLLVNDEIEDDAEG